MARKRTQKKVGKKASDRLRKLEKLRRAGQGMAYLELADQIEDLGAAGLVESHGEVFERCLESRLRSGDLPGLEAVLGHRRPEHEERPVVRLAEAVLALDRGALDEARQLLELVRKGTGDLAMSDRVRRLEGLCWSSTAAPPESLGPDVDELLKLRRSLVRYAAGELKRLPTNTRLVRAENRRTLDFLRALEKVRPGRSTARKALRELVETAGALRRAESIGASSAPLLDGARELALYLDHWSQGWPHPEESGRSEVIEGVVQALEEDRVELVSMLTSESPLLAPLRGELLERLHSLLARTGEVGGSTALARVGAAAGSELAALLGLEMEGETSRERIELWGTFRNSIEQHDYFDLARALHRESERAQDPSQLVRLWGLELWALGRAVELEGRVFGLPFEEEMSRGDRAEKRRMLRLRSMSRELGTRIAEDQRRGLADVLRRQVVEASDEMVCEKALPILTQLLRYLPEDRALLTLALGSALAAERQDLVSQHSDRLASLGPAPEAEIETLVAIASTPPIVRREGILEFYRGVEPLLGDHWPRARDEAALFLELRTLANLNAFLQDFGPPLVWPEQDLAVEVGGFRRILMEDFEVFRPVFGTTISFQTAELLVQSMLDGQSSPVALCSDFLARRPELEAALSCLRLLDTYAEIPGLEEPFGKARQLAMAAMLHRLDDRWWLWKDPIKMVFHDLDGSHLQLLRDHLQTLLQESDHEHRERDEIEYLLDHVLDELRLLDSFHRPKRRAPRRKRKKARRKIAKAEPGSKEEGSNQLDLFDLSELGSGSTGNRES